MSKVPISHLLSTKLIGVGEEKERKEFHNLPVEGKT